jgi:hypothetical protein
MNQAISTALLGILIVAATIYGTLRWIVLDGAPLASNRTEPVNIDY